MRAKFLVAIAWVVLIAITAATLVPLHERPHLANVSLERSLAFVVLGFLFTIAYPRNLLIIVAVVIGSAVLLETLQLLTADRHGRIADLAIKVAGGIAGILVARALLRFQPRWNNPND